ncbi:MULTISPECIES: hypothetical protein [Vibrio]|uniref:hypothetical protein n=1 Tax=Vibrio TaxID=662 RepID=UPI001483BCF4|nr:MULTISPECIES: hypothetical protein [Vibrio]MDQ2164979.1 hypothetical protein [Vibrio anguillarum]MDQ2189846.1 hypothetical protein [Vibrio sp. A14(2019)]MDQ2198023.1 hypothetical protein [Vibrio sp. 2017_1457_11]NNN77094.1 hypothetical protein [Vibrio sp. B7]NNN93922.1 hypothetical protein [Vibrio sp. B8-1]
MMKKIILASVLLFSSLANALTIDTMYLVSDSRGNGVISLTNDLEQTNFVNTYVYELMTDEQGNIVRTQYAEENIDDWKLITTAPKLIIEPGVSKDIGIRALCDPERCARDKDLMFSIAFEPSPYFEEGESQQSFVTINYGYASLFVIPTTQPKISYTLTNQGDYLLAKNTGNTILNLVIDQCTSTVKNNCRITERLVAGRERQIKLPDHFKRNVVDVNIYNHDESYKNKQSLSLTK